MKNVVSAFSRFQSCFDISSDILYKVLLCSNIIIIDSAVPFNPYVIHHSPPCYFAYRSSKAPPFEILNSPTDQELPVIWNIRNQAQGHDNFEILLVKGHLKNKWSLSSNLCLQNWQTGSIPKPHCNNLSLVASLFLKTSQPMNPCLGMVSENQINFHHFTFFLFVSKMLPGSFTCEPPWSILRPKGCVTFLNLNLT